MKLLFTIYAVVLAFLTTSHLSAGHLLWASVFAALTALYIWLAYREGLYEHR